VVPVLQSIHIPACLEPLPETGQRRLTSIAPSYLNAGERDVISSIWALNHRCGKIIACPKWKDEFSG
jgi:hypothetical protein